MSYSNAELLVLLTDAREEIATLGRALDVMKALLLWALGDGPLPRDEEAEGAAIAWLRIAADHGGGALTMRLSAKALPLLSRPIEWPGEGANVEPVLPWREALTRLEMAAVMRRAAGKTRAAARALAAGDAVEAVPLLRRALAELAEGLRRQDGARGKALEAMVDEDARRTG